MKKWRWFSIVLIGILCAGVFLVLFSKQQDFESVDPFITANPLDLTQIAAISQFRSCEGHNFSGKNAQGVEETYRTMKHYIEAIEPLYNTAGQVRIYAPFDGRISDVSDDSRGTNVYLSPDVKAGGWNLEFFHVDLLSEMEDGSVILAGQHIGYANLIGGANFDIALRSFGFGEQRYGTPFEYMTKSVLVEYEQAGVTLENIVISKEDRDADPCELAAGQSGRDAFYARSESGNSWVRMR